MRLLAELDQKNYETQWDVIRRVAARAIVWRGEKLLMVRSEKYGEIKFPGGGIHDGEDAMSAAIRETREETGWELRADSIREYGKTIERRRFRQREKIYEQVSLYYFGDGDEKIFERGKLDDYEIAYGYAPNFFTPAEAIIGNESAIKNFPDEPVAIWAAREIAVLKLLAENL